MGRRKAMRLGFDPFDKLRLIRLLTVVPQSLCGDRPKPTLQKNPPIPP